LVEAEFAQLKELVVDEPLAFGELFGRSADS
jgi:hypothetical protein